jgi:hypothetical protein
MVVIRVPAFAKDLPKPEKAEKMATITIRRGDEWETAPVQMRAGAAIELADECNKRGLIAKVVPA